MSESSEPAASYSEMSDDIGEVMDMEEEHPDTELPEVEAGDDNSNGSGNVGTGNTDAQQPGQTDASDTPATDNPAGEGLPSGGPEGSGENNEPAEPASTDIIIHDNGDIELPEVP